MRRLALVASVLALMAAAACAQAQGWPDRPIKLLVPSTPGSTPDVFARTLADGLREQLGQPVVVENRAGAGGAIAVGAVARAQPDGYTLAITPPGPVGVNTLLYRKLPYDPATQLTLISVGATQSNVVVARSSLGIASLGELVTKAKRDAGKYTYASIGMGSINHLCMELIALNSGTSFTQVNYPGTSQAMLALLGGEVDFGCLPAQAVAPQLHEGKLRALAVATSERSPFLPEVPTLTEAGIKGVEANAWMGVVGPGGLPPAIVQRLANAVAAVVGRRDVREKLAAQYMQPVGTTPAEFAAMVKQDVDRWRPVVAARHIHLD
jgi:tripartite-type tricarboxylate transporter receptor subunit TctC